MFTWLLVNLAFVSRPAEPAIRDGEWDYKSRGLFAVTKVVVGRSISRPAGRSNFYVLEFPHYVVLLGEHKLGGEGNRRCGMVRYGISDVVGASYGWCWDTAARVPGAGTVVAE